MKTPVHILFTWLACGASLTTALAANDYKVVTRYPIGGDKSSYDYLRVDPDTRRLYVAHEKQFEVLDLDTGKMVGVIGPVTRAHGVALSAATGHGFASSGIDDLIIMFDLKTLATIKQFNRRPQIPTRSNTIPKAKRFTPATTVAVALP